MRRLLQKSATILEQEAPQRLKEVLKADNEEIMSLKSLKSIQDCKEHLERSISIMIDVESIINGFIRIKVDQTSKDVREQQVEQAQASRDSLASEQQMNPYLPKPEGPPGMPANFAPPEGFPDFGQKTSSARAELTERLNEFKNQIKQYEKSVKTAHKDEQGS